MTTAVPKPFDVVHLGNLCLDIIVPVADLPPSHPGIRADLLEQLTAKPPSAVSWEVGGASNFMITAARLGQRVACLGQLGDDVYGTFFRSTMVEEGIETLPPLTYEAAAEFATLLCFVLVDPQSRHAFTSRYDFGPWPLLDGVTTLRPDVLQVLSETRALMLNGFVLDELPGPMVIQAAAATRAAGGAVFFDPGPRSWTLLEGERRVALDAILDLADIVLMTQEEAEAVTGHSDPEAAAEWVLARPASATAWVIVKLGSEGAVLCARGAVSPIRIDGLKVPVVDTVGCGDSFAAAIALGYTRGQSTDATLALANAVGAATAMSRGAGRGVASADTVMSLLRAQTGGLLPSPTDVDQTPKKTAALVVAAVHCSSASRPDIAIEHSNGVGSSSSNSSTNGSSAQEQSQLQSADSTVALGLQAPHAPALQAIDFLLGSLDNNEA